MSKVVLVTGGARGIGAASAVRFSRGGWNVAVVDAHLDDTREALTAQIRSNGTDSSFHAADLADVRRCRSVVEEVLARWGRIDAVVNNAGGAFSDYTPFESTTTEYYEHVLAVNLRAPYFLTQAAAPALRAAKGSVVFIASELVFRGYELTAPYVAAKGGIVALNRSVALALAPDVRVNCVAPGPTASERFLDEPWNTDERIDEIPLQRFGTTTDVANAIYFLATDEAAQITGQTLSVNGGVVMP